MLPQKKTQRWPLINIVRQILKQYNFLFEPIRKSDGYTEDGKKKYTVLIFGVLY